MKMPSTVSDERSGCIKRFLTLSCSVRNQTENIGEWSSGVEEERSSGVVK
jgi:hypothetical protein